MLIIARNPRNNRLNLVNIIIRRTFDSIKTNIMIDLDGVAKRKNQRATFDLHIKKLEKSLEEDTGEVTIEHSQINVNGSEDRLDIKVNGHTKYISIINKYKKRETNGYRNFILNPTTIISHWGFDNNIEADMKILRLIGRLTTKTEELKTIFRYMFEGYSNKD